MDEKTFLKKLQERAKEQESIMKEMPFSRTFTAISLWLGNHPWRIGIPFALVLSLILRLLIGPLYDEFILKVFGGFGLVKLY